MLCLDPNGRACARAANAVRVPAGMFSLVADSGMVLFVSGVSNLIEALSVEPSIRKESKPGRKLTDYFWVGGRHF